MISGGGFQGKTETACQAAAEFEDLWRGIHRQLVPGPVPGTRDVFVPVAYCRLPVKATPKALCKQLTSISTETRTPPPCMTWFGRSASGSRPCHDGPADRRHHEAQAAPRR